LKAPATIRAIDPKNEPVTPLFFDLAIPTKSVCRFKRPHPITASLLYKEPKESTPGWRDISLRFSPESALASTRRAQNTRLGLEHEARFSRFRLRCSGAPYGAKRTP
jgi:hypothetical protein